MKVQILQCFTPFSFGGGGYEENNDHSGFVLFLGSLVALVGQPFPSIDNDLFAQGTINTTVLREIVYYDMSWASNVRVYIYARVRI